MEITFLVNGTIVLQNDPSLVYGTWAIVIITLIGIITTAVLTMKSLNLTKGSLDATLLQVKAIQRSNELIEQEQNILHKAKLELVKSQSSLQGREGDYHIKLFYTIKNSGNLTMSNLVRWSFASNNDDTYHIVQDWQSSKNQYQKLQSIGAGIPLELMEQMELPEKRSGRHWIVCFEYEYLSKKEKCIIVFIKPSGGQEPVPHRIIPNEEIVIAEKRFDDERSGSISAPT